MFNADGRSTNTLIALGINYAVENGADVISMSFGSSCGDDECEIASSVKNAVSSGVVCVAAAGNETENVSNKCPAGIKECITVSSVDENDNLSEFSNYGSAVDIAAPGENIWSSTLTSRGSY